MIVSFMRVKSKIEKKNKFLSKDYKINLKYYIISIIYYITFSNLFELN